MTRTILDTQLQEIRTKIIQLGTLVDTALEHSLQAAQHSDQALCGKVIAADDTIDRLRSEIEQLAFRSLTLQQPLGGRDLRFLSSVLTITGDLERMGDNAEGIATLLIRMDQLPKSDISYVYLDPAEQTRSATLPVTEASIVSSIIELGQEARRVVQGTVRAFEQQNADAARYIWQEDDLVDVRYHMVRHNILTMLAGIHAIPALQQDAHSMQRITYWLWIAHNIERIGDHCTNICERIVFYLEGDRTITPSDPL
jgi:phosphate transport system protein